MMQVGLEAEARLAVLGGHRIEARQLLIRSSR